jgi:hypothetical protein
MAGLDDEGEEHPCKVPRTSRSNSSVWASNAREGDPCATSVEDLSVPSLGLPFSCEQGSGASKSADQEEDRIKTLQDLALPDDGLQASHLSALLMTSIDL